MPDKPWKRAERRVAKLFKTARTGPTGKDDSDVIHPLLAIEIKYMAKLPKWALDCLEQARTGRTAAGKTPVTIQLQHGMRVGDGIICMRVAAFEELFGKLQQKEVDP